MTTDIDALTDAELLARFSKLQYLEARERNPFAGPMALVDPETVKAISALIRAGAAAQAQKVASAEPVNGFSLTMREGLRTFTHTSPLVTSRFNAVVSVLHAPAHAPGDVDAVIADISGLYTFWDEKPIEGVREIVDRAAAMLAALRAERDAWRKISMNDTDAACKYMEERDAARAENEALREMVSLLLAPHTMSADQLATIRREWAASDSEGEKP